MLTFRIKDFDDTAAGMYKCQVTFDDNVVEGFVDAQIFGSSNEVLLFLALLHNCNGFKFLTQSSKFCLTYRQSRLTLETALGSIARLDWSFHRKCQLNLTLFCTGDRRPLSCHYVVKGGI